MIFVVVYATYRTAHAGNPQRLKCLLFPLPKTNTPLVSPIAKALSSWCSLQSPNLRT